VYDIERDAQKLDKGGGEDLVYRNLLADHLGAPKRPENDDQEAERSSDDSGEGASISGDESGEGVSFEKGPPRGRRFEDKDEKKVSRRHILW
jgi:RIO kinase 1